jgi:SAM-dependent methyltransferase
VTLIGAGAGDIPLQAHSLDTVVSTWTLCSIPEAERALAAIRRVRKPQGRLMFIEHGLAPDPVVARTQARLLPVVRGLAGCTLNREMDRLIRDAGFRFAVLGRCYLGGRASSPITTSARPNRHRRQKRDELSFVSACAHAASKRAFVAAASAVLPCASCACIRP